MVSRVVVVLDVVASQAWERNVSDGRRGGVSLPWVVWLRADVGVGWDGDTAGGGGSCCLGGGCGLS